MEKKLYELTNPQKSIWLTESYSHSNVNNISGNIHIHAPIDIDCLKKALNAYVEKNDAIRTRIVIDGETPKQYIHEYEPFSIEVVSLSSEKDLTDFNQSIVTIPFDLIDSDLFSFTIFQFPDLTGGLNVTFHHIISDAWTMGLFISEVMDTYTKLVNKEEVDFTSNPSYLDYISSEKEYLNSSKFQKDQEFWNQFFTETPELAKITDQPLINNSVAKRSTFHLDTSLYQNIMEYCNSLRCSIYTFFMAVFSIYLSKINNISSPIIGTPVLNRTNFKEKNTAGMYISTIPFKAKVDSDATFEDFLKNVMGTQMSIFRHQKYPYSVLLEDLKKKYDYSENLYQVALSYQNARNNREDCETPYSSEWLFTGQTVDPLEIHFYDIDNTGVFDIYYDYQVNHFDEESINQIHNRILSIINQVLANTQVLLKDVEIVTKEEKNEILLKFNNTNIPYDKQTSLVNTFEDQAITHPNDIALVFENKYYSYRELNEKANQLAHYLKSLSVKDNDKIAILLPRGYDLIVSMLAIKKANCAYLLIEKSLPLDRVKYMLETADVSYVITNKQLSSNQFNCLVIEDIDLNKFPTSDLKLDYLPENYLSVVYTSGSTGNPKGILVKNSSILNLVLGYCHSMQAHTFSNFLSICSVSFDMFAAEVWVPLLLGKKLVLTNEEEAMNPILMSSIIENYKIEFMLITPSRMALLLDDNINKCLLNLKAVQLGGEVLEPQFYDKLIQYTNSKIYNGYGPSETTSCATCKLVTSSKDITIGTPLPNIQTYICNEVGNLCPPNIAGELCISGDGVSYGYINQPELTDKNFIKNPFGDGLLYRTGDLAKFLPDGEIAFIGRTDSQVKIRGLRIELEEINKVISEFSNIEKSVTLVNKINGIDSICCYFVGKEINMDDLKAYAGQKLPYYMVPSHFICLDAFPLTANGKVDTKKLPEIKIDSVFVSPETDLETKLCNLWQDLFNLDRISVTTNFFDLGGDSLGAIRLITQIEQSLNVKITVNDIFTYSNIRDLANYIESLNNKNEISKIQKISEREFYPASSAQKRIYYASSMDKDSVLYNIAGGIVVDKILDIDLLQKCLQALIDRHEVLRTRFAIIDDEIVQIVEDKIDFSLSKETSDSSDLNSIYADFIKPFDLSKAPLFRAKVITLPDEKMLLLLDMHHIISDGTSLSILLQELCNLYNGQSLIEKQVDYKDFTLWEKEQFEKEEFKKSKEFWVNQYKDEIPLLNMPTTYSRPSVQSFEGANYFTVLSKEIFDNVNKISKNLSITPYMLMLSAYYILLSKYTSQNDIVVGTPIVGRELPELSNMLGMFVNTLALRNKVESSNSFQEFTNSIKDNCLSAFQNQSYPFDELVKELNIKRDTSRNPLVDVMFVYQNDGFPSIDLDGSNVEYFVPDNKIAKFDLTLEVIPVKDEYSVRFEYCTKLFDEDYIKRLSSHYINILNAILKNPDIKIADIDMLSEEEKHQILYDFNNTTVDYPRDKTIVDLFEEQVEKTPDNIAIVFEDQKLTYRELNEKANQLARCLISNGVNPGDIVGIYLTRCPEFVISIFATLKVGAAYMPMFTGYPVDRLQYMLENSNSKCLITNSALSKNINDISKIIIDKDAMPSESDDLKIPISPSSLAYVIYTSGSTGKPKGVKIAHENLINFVYAFNKYYNSITPEDTFLASTNISFDVSVWEFFMSLLFGAKLVLNSEEIISDISLYCKNIIENKITALYIPPNILDEVYYLLSKNNVTSISKLLVGVEPIRKSTLNNYYNLNSNLIIVNGYGPTETTICSTALVYERDISEDSFVSIGNPLCNNQIYIIDSNNNVCPIGIPGELCVAGAGVGKGYLNNIKETEKAFVKNPFDKDSSILYKTGDLAKWNSDGTINFVGRIDNQIKLSGYRIELNEINNCINRYNSISSAFTTLLKIKNKDHIISYFISKEKVDIQKLSDYLHTKLPFYMVPKFLIEVSDFPLTPNGKIDAKKLPVPNFEQTNKYISPKTSLEKRMAIIVQSLLGIDKISIVDNLFDYGLDSLMCIKLSVKVLEELNISLTVNDIFEHPTIQDLSTYISSLSISQKNIISPTSKKDFYPASSAQKRIYYASSMDKDSVLYNIAGGIVVDKILDIDLLQKCFQALIDRHEVLRTRFAIIDDQIVQIIEDKIDFNLLKEFSDSSDLNSIYADFIKPFDLSKAPLFRAKVVTLPDGKMLLLLDMHHIISDGTSLSILLQELCNLYNGQSLIEKQVDYKDFTLWEKEQFEKEEFKKSKEFWVNQYKDEIPLLNIPTTYDRPSTQSFKGSTYKATLSNEVFGKVSNISKELNITPYMLMLSAYYILLSKYTSQNDIVVGTPIVGRELPELSNMLGMFVNTLALRNKIDSNSNFKDFANSIKDYCLLAFQNQSYPFDELVKELKIKKDTSRGSLIDTMFIYQNDGYPTIDFKNAHTEYFIPNSTVAKFDLSIEIIPMMNQFSVQFEYCTKLFDEDYIKRLSSHYINILNAILKNPDIKIADIDMLSEDEKHQILYDFNNTTVDYPRDKTIVDLFEEQVEKTPNNVAVVFEDQKLTYCELNEKANQLARYLINNDVSNNDIICLLLDKSLESIIAIIATLKIGAAYLPIDVNYPSDRIDYIIKDSGASVLLTTTNNIHKSNNTITAICIDLDSNIYIQNLSDNINIKNITPDSLAYIMYTSGSTGNPKGVMINHRNIVRLIKNTNYINFDKQERILQTGSIVFDACTFEIYGALLNGFELYIIKKEQLLDSSLLQDYLIKNKITTLWLTAPLFNQLCEENPHMFSTVNKLLTGGDVLSPKHINMVKSANPNLTVINGYGPTENTTFSCCFTIDKKYTKSIPIGGPIANSTAYVVSSSGKLCPIGVPGELWVGGDGVGKGYLNNEELTNKKFIPNPFGKGTIYKTGDLVKWLPNGTIDFIGRIDNQVKIRGFRVELGEINSKIASFPTIKECATVVHNIKGDKTICSYIVSDKEINIQELKQYLKRNLPVYMIPSYFMQLDKLPINTNGKIDKNALPTNFKLNLSDHKVKLPSNDIEQILLDIFKKLLSFDDIGIDDDFFELGGDSLLAIKLQVEAVSNNLQINYADIFDHPTVEELAKCVGQTEDTFTENSIDFAKYDTILRNNKITKNMNINNTPIGNVLLTGFTGFLGAHVLDSFIKKETGTIYCLIRGKNNMSPEERLMNVLHFYFDTKYDQYVGNRIKLVEGDITSQDFGLNVIDYNMLGTDVNTVIHCAALVKHYGTYKEFESINILGTKKVIDFSKAFDLKLLHVSTISVSGNNLVEGANVDNHFEDEMIFDETNFYIGQDLKNFYVRSKFEAEKLVLDAILDGLQGCILRMGNLTSRFSEGKFQQNHFENAFVNTIKSFIQIGCIPDYLLQSYCEFTPIDFCGNAVIDIANHMTKDYTVFHLLNEKHVPLDRLFTMLREIGIDVNIVSANEFENIIMNLLKDESKKNKLDGIINNLDHDKKFIYKSDVTIESDFTKEFLNKIGFEWPYIDINYIRNYFKYLSDIGYFNLKVD